jgi:hypothetical protein
MFAGGFGRQFFYRVSPFRSAVQKQHSGQRD